jgi:hypothetical protein
MSSLKAQLNSLIPRPVQIVIVVGLVLTAGTSDAVIGPFGPLLWSVNMKLQGKADACPWDRILTIHSDLQLLSELNELAEAGGRVESRDEEWGIELVSLPTSARKFWIRTSGERMNGEALVAHLVAEHRRTPLASSSPETSSSIAGHTSESWSIRPSKGERQKSSRSTQTRLSWSA